MSTHFKSAVYSQGMLLSPNGVPATFGKYWFVDADNGSDSNPGDRMDRAFATISAAYSAARTNKHDVIILSAYGGHTLTDQLTITKNRLHFIGLDLGARYYGQRTRLTLGVSTGTAIAAIHNTGVGNTFRNLKITSNDTLATSVYGVAEGGEFSLWENCEFLKATDLDQAGAAELLHNGDSCVFRNCTFGNGIYTPTAARQNVLFTRETISGKVARDVIFENCLFMNRAGATTVVNVRATTNDIERLCLFQDCKFVAVKTSTATQALAFGIASALTDAEIILKDCIVQNITNTATGSRGVFTNSVTPVADATETVQVSTT